MTAACSLTERLDATNLKVCCISSIEEARLAASAGADLLGLVSAMPSGPGPIPDELIAEIVAEVTGWGSDRPSTVLLTSRTDATGVAAQIEAIGPDLIQLVDALPAEELVELTSLYGPERFLAVVHVAGEESVAEALRLAPLVGQLLLDSGRPNAAVKELGGTGRTHDWSLSAEIVERVDVPVWLAGGLGPTNVADAVASAGPFGVDLCSSVRRDGALDAELLGSLVQAMGRRRD